jgi:hypothetical protein
MPPVLLKLSHKLIQKLKGPRVSKKLEGQKRLHLACGKIVLSGWANIDLKNDGAVIAWDLTERLPVR